MIWQFIGDSLAEGTHLAPYTDARIVKRAQVGIGTADGVRRFLHPLTGQVLIVSLGTNDFGRPAAVSAPARRVVVAARRARMCLLWVQVSGVPNAAQINRRIRRAGVKFIVPWHLHAVHPDAHGYVVRAKRIVRYVRRDCP